MFSAYKRYPFPISARTKFFNILRYLFIFPPLEKFLISQLVRGHLNWWRKFIPPLYFYKQGSIRLAERRNKNYVLDISKLLDHSIYFCTVKDTAWENLFKMLRPDFHVIDGGANIGFLSLNFAQTCFKGFVYSFEPDSENFNALERNVNCNNFKNIRLFKKALGKEPGSAQLYKMYTSNPGANRILPTKPPREIISESIEIITLDGLFTQKIFERVDLLKLDIEGFELFALQGAREIINHWKPLLFIELAEANLRVQNCTAIGLIEYIESLGYHVWDARTMQPIDKSFNDHHTDIICSINSIDTRS
jgi:FkbM family methyltransferase